MNRNKNLLILYYLWKNLSKFSIEQKKVFHTLSFQLCSTASSKSSFNVSLWKIHYFKIQTISLVSKSIYFSRYSLCFIYFDVSFVSYWKKLQTNWFFFQSHEYNKNMWSRATTDTGCLEILSYSRTTFNRLKILTWKWCLCSLTLGRRPLSSALGFWSHLVGPRLPKCCKNKVMNKEYYLFKIILIQDWSIMLIQDIQKAI